MTRQVSDLDADYAAAGFGGSLGWGARPVVVAIDVCMAYLDPASPLYAGVEDARDAIAELVAAARAAGVPVVWTKVEYEPGGADGGVFYRKVASLSVFQRGASDLGEFPAEAAPVEGERVYTKQYPSAFFGTGLADRLHADGIDTVVLCGFSTSGCVRATVVDGLSCGYRMIVPEECVADKHESPHFANLYDMAVKYADVLPVAEVLAAIPRMEG